MLQYERGIAFFGANLQIALCVQINPKPNVEISADCTRVYQPLTLAHLDNTIFNESNICGGAAHIHNHGIFSPVKKEPPMTPAAVPESIVWAFLLPFPLS